MQVQDLPKIMFLDIETVPLTGNFDALSPELAHIWEDKCIAMQKRNAGNMPADETVAGMFEKSAALSAEFGRIVCISVGFIYFNNNQMNFRTKSFCYDDEKRILEEFCALLNKFCTTREHTLCGHNLKDFDVPFICRRLLINGIQLPELLRISGKKPWEITFHDTMDMWKFGDFKYNASLKLLTAVFGIPTPKDDIDGSQVAGVFYKEHNLARIATYCQKDVVATAQVFLKLNGMDTITDTNITNL